MGLVLTGLAPTAWSQSVYGIDSGVTSISFHKPVLDSLGFIISGTEGTVAPADGFQSGFQISQSTAPGDAFCFTLDPFEPGSGIVEHSGTIEISGAFSMGNFEVQYDATRESATHSGFFLTDKADLDTVLFDVGTPDSDTINESVFIIDRADLLIAPEFANNILGDPGLVNVDAGDLRVDALVGLKRIPEPSTAILSLFGVLLVVRRRRP